jgi:hypothetical protein
MFRLGTARRRAGATLVAGLTATAVAFVGLGAAGASAAPPSVGERAKTISNELVEIEPAQVHGTYTDPDSGRTGKVVAKFMPKEFAAEDGDLTVTGVVSGVLTGQLPKGTPRHFSEEVTTTVTSSAQDATSTAGFQTAAFSAADAAPAAEDGCDILNLDLGPLDLNLLGLQIDLAPVVLDIVAQPGAGALLGNLLCAVAGLLDPGSGLGDLLDGLLDGVAGVLNGLLGGQLDGDVVTGLIGEITGLLEGATQTQSV